MVMKMDKLLSRKFVPPRVIGHRGACAYAPENTLIAMQVAADLGVKWIEFDVMLTRDEEAIIMHDETLDRTTNGHGRVADTPYSVIEKLDAGSWFAPKFAGTKVPTFEELLIYLRNLAMNLVVEIKPTPGKEIVTAEKTMELLERYWPMTELVPLISSAKEKGLQTVYDINPTLLLGFISDKWLPNWQDKLEMLHCISLHSNHKVLNPSRVEAVKKAGYFVLAYTVNDPKRAQELFSWGVDGVFTNVPDKIEWETRN